MKTYEIKMNRSRWFSCVIAILCLVLIIMMLSPYFTYGKNATTLVPENSADGKTMGDQNILYGRTWVLSGAAEDQDGYQRIEVGTDGKNNSSTLYTTNILRVNQKNTIATFNTCLDNYNAIAQNVEDCETYIHECDKKLEELISAANLVAVKLGKTPFSAEAIEAAAEAEAAGAASEEAASEEAAEAPAAEAPATEANEADVDYKVLTDAIAKAEKELVKAEGFKATAEANLARAEAALNQAYEAVKGAYAEDIDASFAWVTETTDAYNDAIREAYPDDFIVGYAVSKDGDFKKFLATKYPDEFAAITDRKPENKLYDQIMPKLSAAEKMDLYKEFMAAAGELSADDVKGAVEKTLDEIASRISDEERDEQVYGKLKAMKAKSNAAAAAAKKADSETAAALKAGEKKQTTDKAAKIPANIEKQLKNITALYEKYGITVPEAEEEPAEDTFKPAAVKRYSLDEFEADELEAKQTEDTLMKTPCTVKYSKRNTDTVGKVDITFANGDTKTTSFGTSVEYDGTKEVSILGFVGFPEDLKDTFEKEVAYQVYGYSRNSAILMPIVLLVLLVLGLVFAIIKRDSFGSAICPTLAGLLGVIAYLASDFLKLGDKHTLHTIGFAVLLVVAGVHLYFGIKEKLAAREGK